MSAADEIRELWEHGLPPEIKLWFDDNAEAIAELIEAADKVATVHYRVEQDCFRKLRSALAKLNTGNGEG